jgi:hypothetical protein
VFVPTLRTEIAAETRPTHRVVLTLTLRPSSCVVIVFLVLCIVSPIVSDLSAHLYYNDIDKHLEVPVLRSDSWAMFIWR